MAKWTRRASGHPVLAGLLVSLSPCLLIGLTTPALVVSPTAATAGGQTEGSDWPRFLGPLGTSVSTEKGIISPWPQEGLRLVWQRKLGTGYGAPSIAAGKLYVFDRDLEQVVIDGKVRYRESKNARLVCLDARTSKEHWSFKYPTDYRDFYGYNNGPRCCPVIDGDRVYTYGAEGIIHCLKADSGERIWNVDTAAQFGVVQNFFGVGSTPVVEGDLLIAVVGGSPPGSDPREFLELKGNKSAIVAFDKFTGKIRYRISDELAGYAGPVLATINGRRLCLAFCRGGLLAFDPADGKIDLHFPWRSPDLESVNASNPVVVGDQVLISECYGPGGVLLKLQPGKAEVVWSDAKKPKTQKSLMCHWMTPIHHEGYVYGCSGRNTADATLRCVELATGKVMWSEPRLTRSSLLMADGHFICLSEDGMLRMLKVNPKKYDLVSELDVIDPRTKRPLLDYPCWAAPVLSHGLLYVRGEDQLVCLELIPQKK
jgi:outer membrane protein assembly factor BamB